MLVHNCDTIKYTIRLQLEAPTISVAFHIFGLGGQMGRDWCLSEVGGR